MSRGHSAGEEHGRRAWAFFVPAVTLVAGCGLALDLGPPDRGRADARGSMDGGPGGVDGGPALDAPLPPDDTGGVASDAVVVDAVITPSDGFICPESPCRILEPQCGCRPGQACQFYPGVGRMCGTPGVGEEATRCDTPEDCLAGLACGLIVSRPGVCTRFCETDADCDGPGSRCVELLYSGGMSYVPPVHACTPSCDPISGARCDGLACDIVFRGGASTAAVTVCRAVGSGEVGVSCTRPTDCAVGFLCAVGLTDQCQEICDLSAPVCRAGGTCSPITGWVIGSSSYGLCLSG